ncbi:MAG: phytanoyl-CoA dioxygenase family protein, partial [Candidatus Poribacteria bacterium]|nr:phytanoyl-CoA dioxygenase family protein [Candidatus Poribacteria bacterium]
HRLHGSGEPFSPSTWYHHQNGRIFCRGVTVAWQLYGVNEGDGGFCIVPGSHKSQVRPPVGVITADDDMGLVLQPAMKSGDVLFFAETATHGTLPWTGKSPRRSILYKYASRAAARAVGRFFTPEERYGEWTKELTPEGHSLLYGPGHHTGSRKRHALESDGEKVWLAD